MSIHLDEHPELLAELPHDAQTVLRAAWSEAVRVFSARGLDHYLRGAVALHALGRGEELVVSYVQAMPELARAIGEDSLPDVVGALLAMASKTSGAVLALVAATAPLAALRLADADLFRQYLGVLDMVLTQAPRGMRPLLDNLDRLLGQLTLGGLRRWAAWGAQAYKSDFDGQARYFGLQSSDALAVLQQERQGTLFVDVQRRLNIYLRAMWGRDFFLRPTAGDLASGMAPRPYVEQHVVHLPDACDDWPATPGDIPAETPAVEPVVDGLSLYRAMCNHCAAHLVFGPAALPDEGLDALDKALVELVEDARVEALACRRFPGMRDGWLALHRAADLGEPPSVIALLDRLARAWLADDDADPHPWVRQGVQALRDEPTLDDPTLSLRLGSALAAALRRLDLPRFNPRLDVPSAAYRDDNRVVWEQEAYSEAQALEATWAPKQVRKRVSVIEMVNALDVEFAGDDAQEVWILPTEFYLDQEGVTINSLLGRPPVAEPVHYPEWDYQIQLERPSWATVIERHPPLGDPAAVDAIVAEHKPVLARLKYMIESMSPQGVQRVRRLEEGDELDLEAAVRALVDLRTGQQPDPRIMMRNRLSQRDLAVLVLLDLSESSNDRVRGQEQTVLELTRAATVLLAGALDRIGDPFALHGFCSDGRHDVHYHRFKDFDEPYGETVKARLAGMKGAFSTRMGAALRHAGVLIGRQPQRRKIVFVVTDGEPADNDVRDPQYLRHDTRRAVESLARQGVSTYALSLDPHADLYVTRIFGARNHTVLDRAERLPEKLPQLYLGLTS
jgi:nitric oxide reductase NorD protein